MQGSCLLLQPLIEFRCGELVAQEILDFYCVLDLPLLIVEFL
jgi:hypothetical protein